MLNETLLKKTLEPLKISLSNDSSDRLSQYFTLFAAKNSVMNLSAIRDDDAITVKHFADSLALLHFKEFENGGKLLDLGTGGGFPGVPLLLSGNGFEVTFLDSTKKKTDFIRESLDKINYGRYRVLSERAEELAFNNSFREHFDIVTARGVAELRKLVEITLPFLKTDGMLCALKNENCEEELKNAKNAIKLLGGELSADYIYSVGDEKRRLIVIKKIKPTDMKYPRTWGKIGKSPL